MNDYAAIVQKNIESHGFHVTYVAGSKSPPFCYSTGIFQSFSIPEVFISSLPPNLSHELITQYVKRHAQTGPPLNERMKAIGERFDYYLIPVSLQRLREHVLASLKYYGDRPFECVQLIYPDPMLLFPGEPGYNYDQEIFGEFPPDLA